MLIDYFICLSWILMINCAGLILSRYFNFFDIYIFLIVLSIYTFFISSIMFIFDRSQPYEILLKLYNLNRYDKLKLAFISFPISILYSIALLKPSTNKIVLLTRDIFELKKVLFGKVVNFFSIFNSYNSLLSL